MRKLSPFHALVLGLSLLSILILITAQNARAQSVTDGTTPGALTPGAPSGSYALSGLDNVNLYNGNLHFNLPLVNVGGRGNAHVSVGLFIERHWRVEHMPNPDPNAGYPIDYATYTDYLYRPYFEPGRIELRTIGHSHSQCYPPNEFWDPEAWTETLTRLTFTTANGTEYELIDTATDGRVAANGSCHFGNNYRYRGTVFTSRDGSGLTFVADSQVVDDPWGNTYISGGYLLFRDGTRYRFDGGHISWIRDRNGNLITFTYGTDPNNMNTWGRLIAIQDSLNRQVTFEYNVNDSAPYGLCDRITVMGVGGTPRIIRISRDSLNNLLRMTQAGDSSTTKSSYELFPTLNGSSSYDNFNPTDLFSAVWLPNGQSYKFRYNVYAELARVELPTGGAIEYDYGAGDSGDVAYGGVHGWGPYEIYRRALARRVYKETNQLEGVSTYSREVVDQAATQYDIARTHVDTVSMDPGGTVMSKGRHFFYGSALNSLFTGGYYPNSWKGGREYKTEALATDGSDTVLRRVENTFQQRAHISWWTNPIEFEPENDPRLVEARVTLADTNQVSTKTFGYDQFNNETDSYEYDYGSGSPGPLVRRSHTDYLTVNPVNGIDYTGTNIHIRSLPTQTSVYDAGGIERARTTFEYDNYSADGNHAPLVDRPGISGMDASFTSAYQTRGNVTRVSHWLLSNGTSINTYAQYDVAGNGIKAIDGRGLVAQVEYSSANQYAYPTHTISPVPDIGNSYCSTTALETWTAYDFWTGLVISSTDANNQTTTIQYNDALERPTTILRPDGGWTVYSYNDTPGLVYVNSRSLRDPSNVTDSYQYFDGLGRPNRTALNEGGGTWLFTEKQFDALSRVWRVANPYRSGTPVWNTTQFDALGRATSVTTPDGAQVTTSYSGNQVTVTDQEGKLRRSVSDALGRVTQVIEAPNDPNYNYQTSYSYDVLGNLSTVIQGSQHRYFMYDSLSRLLRAKNPEQDANAGLALYDPISGNSQWSMAYAYDNDGNLSSRTDARGVTASYTYDNINRNIIVNYSDGSHIDRVYDSATNGRGRPYYSAYYPTSGAYSVTVIDTYDAMGRPKYQRQHFWANGAWSNAFVTQRDYDFLGHATSQTYPSGRVVNYSYDSVGRTYGFTGNLGDGVTRTYATGISYDEWGGIAREQFGTDTPLYHKEHRNIRGQLYDIRLSTVNDDLNWNRGAIVNYYSFQPYGFGTSGPDNNGNLLVQQSFVPTDDAISSYSFMQQNYAYDSLNRITWVGEFQNGGPHTGAQGYSYDRYGNRTLSGWFGTGIPGQTFSVDPNNNNRLSVPSGQSGSMQYDANGNLTYDSYSGMGSRGYDVENRMVSATNNSGLVSIYTYDAEGHRVRRNSYNQEVWQVYGIGGELLAEYAANASPSTPQKEYGYRNGELLVTASGSADVRWMVSDQLGTPRIIADRTGSLSGISRHDYLPFGEELFAGSGGRTTTQGYSQPDGVRERFTGKERDDETGLDYFGARYYGSPQGRFTSVDPLQASAHATNPQSWNRYSYALNNPLRFVDPTGMAAEGGDPTQTMQFLGRDPGEDPDSAFGLMNEMDDWKIEAEEEEAEREAQQQEEKPQPANITPNTATPEQANLIDAGHNEAERRVQTITACAELYGGVNNALITLNDLLFTIAPNLPADGHPLAVSGPGTIIYINPNATGGLMTPNGSSYSYHLVNPSNNKVFDLTLTGAEARAFAELHEGRHKNKGGFGKTDNDNPGPRNNLNLNRLRNNYINNWIVWNACFRDRSITPNTGIGLPR